MRESRYVTSFVYQIGNDNSYWCTCINDFTHVSDLIPML